ncbi:MAG: DUF5808 domain-containing protein, partial [Bacteroidota bacterium]
EQELQWQKDPKNWKLGIFYYNKEDKRIFPPKRIASMGFTVNFANTKSVVAFALFAAFFAVMIYLITNKK